MDNTHAGKTVLITGGSQGIGLASAYHFARAGAARVIITGRDPARLEEARSSLEADTGCEAVGWPLDSVDTAEVARKMGTLDTLDILVNNAGSTQVGSIEALSHDQWRASVDSKLIGYVTYCREAISIMKPRGSGVILNNIGFAAENWDYNYVAGSTVNAALVSLTKALGGESVSYGVRVLGVSPSFVNTPRIAAFKNNLLRQEGGRERADKFNPIPVESMADLISWLTSDQARYISGTVVTMDNGIGARRPIF